MDGRGTSTDGSVGGTRSPWVPTLLSETSGPPTANSHSLAIGPGAGATCRCFVDGFLPYNLCDL